MSIIICQMLSQQHQYCLVSPWFMVTDLSSMLIKIFQENLDLETVYQGKKLIASGCLEVKLEQKLECEWTTNNCEMPGGKNIAIKWYCFLQAITVGLQILLFSFGGPSLVLGLCKNLWTHFRSTTNDWQAFANMREWSRSPDIIFY